MAADRRDARGADAAIRSEYLKRADATIREAAWEQVRGRLELHGGFWLGFVFGVPSGVLGDVIQRSRDHLRGSTRPVVVRDLREPGDLMETLSWVAGVAAKAAPGMVWVVDRTGLTDDAWRSFLWRFNERRETIRAALPGGLVIAGPRRLLSLVRDVAPDIWSYRATVYLAPQEIDLPPERRTYRPAGSVPRLSEEELNQFAEGALRPAQSPSPALAPLFRRAESELQAGRYAEVVTLALRVEPETALDAQLAAYYLARGRDGQDDAPAAVQSAREAMAGPDPLGTDRITDLLLIVGGSSDRQLAADAAARRVAIARRARDSHYGDAQHPPDLALAEALNSLSSALTDAGDLDGALIATSESTALYRRLVATDQDRFTPDLARLLSNMSVDLGAVGRRQEGLAAVEEAVGYYRRLAAEVPDAYLPGLALSLSNMSASLGASGRLEEGLAAAEEALSIRRGLAAEVPDVYLPDLALSLSNLSVRLGASGRLEEGLAAAEEALSIRRGLAAESPDVYLPDLALSLSNLSVRLGEVGRLEEGLAAVEEAVSIRRRLAAEVPDAYLPDLALSLSNMSVSLGEVGREEEGLAAAAEAASMYRRLAESYPGVYMSRLAEALSDLGERLAEAGRADEAAAVAGESAALRERMASQGGE
jgi:Tetratricopeptide repeat